MVIPVDTEIPESERTHSKEVSELVLGLLNVEGREGLELVKGLQQERW